MRVLSFEEAKLVSGAELSVAAAAAMSAQASFFDTTLTALWAATAAPAGVAEFSLAARVAALVVSPAGAAVTGTFMTAYALGTALNNLTGASEHLADFVYGMVHGDEMAAGAGGSGNGGGYYQDPNGYNPWDQNPNYDWNDGGSDLTPGGYWNEIPPGYEMYF